MGSLRHSPILALASLSLLVAVSAEPDQLVYRGLLAKQSTDRFGLTLREVREGPLLIQALAAGPEVLACEEVLLPGDPPPPPSSYNSSSYTDLPPEFAWLQSYREDCRRAEGVHSRAKRATPKRKTRHGRKKMHKIRKSRRKDHLAKGKTGRWSETFITPGTKWCGPSNMARRYADLGPSWEADRCCRTHDQCQKYILGMSRNYSQVNFNPFTLSHCSCDRSKAPQPPRKMSAPQLARPAAGSKALDETLRVPGTMWCGRGYSATSYGQLGAFAAADRCCRRHDTACPHYIPALSYRFGVYNWRPSTLMHCHCDRRFRTCLKMAGTTASNFVGKLFFNLVQTKCFVLKTERICVQRNWLGKCQKTEMRRLAQVRENMGY